MLANDLLTWYAAHGRDLPWRRTNDPYAIWVSEIMLQQTQVDTVLPYYERFMVRFPDAQALAKATQEEVLNLWEGLGYYARARNLHRAAGIIVERFSGQLPQTERELIELPSVGQYTAAALLAIAFDQDTLALEGNLRRVLTRLSDLHLDPRRPEGERKLRQYGLSLLPSGRASDFNQALMDLGALICTPRSPDCHICPLSNECLARKNGTQGELPLRRPKRPLPLRRAVAAVMFDNDNLLITRRPEGGLLGGLWGFPGGFTEDGESNRQVLSRVIKDQLNLDVEIHRSLAPLTHTYTHFRASLQPYICQVRTTSPHLRERDDVRWVKTNDLDSVPMGKLDRMLARGLEPLLI